MISPTATHQTETVASAVIHPIFLGSAFVNDDSLYDLVSKVMGDFNADAVPVNGLKEKVSEEIDSGCILSIVNTICLLLKKVWHMICMNCSANYFNKFVRAAQLITEADRSHQAHLLLLARERETQLAQTQTAEEKQAEIHAKENRIQELQTEIYQQEEVLRTCLEKYQCVSEYIRAQKNLESIEKSWFSTSKAKQEAEASVRNKRMQFQRLFPNAGREDAAIIHDALQSQKGDLENILMKFKSSKIEIENELQQIRAQSNDQAPSVRPCFYSQMIEAIAQHSSQTLSLIWNMAFEKAPRNNILSWSIEPANDGAFNCTLILNQSLQLWVPAVNDDGSQDSDLDPGGSVLLFGANESKMLKFQLNPKKRSMIFLSGFEIFFHRKLVLKSFHRQPILGLEECGKESIKMTIQMVGSRSKEKSLNNFLTNWNQHGLLVEDYEHFLKSKSAPLLAN